MTNEINNPHQKNKPTFIQLIIPVLLAVMVFLLGIIAFFAKSYYQDAKTYQNTQQQINLQVLENLGKLNAGGDEQQSAIKLLQVNDRRQDIMLQDHETKLNLLK
ncbi:MAG: hypothetical protein RQ761_10425 [Bacteroidales bacterium]|nr:hypothetical protein [Bacteroidales bacterium]